MSKKNIIIYTVLFIFVITVLWFDFVKKGESVKLVQKKSQLEKKLKQAQQAKRRVEKFEQEEREEIAQKEKMLQQKIPINSVDILDIVTKLSIIGKEKGVKKIDFEPKKMVKVSNAKKSTSGMPQVQVEQAQMYEGYEGNETEDKGNNFSPDGKNGKLTLYKYPIQLEFQGTYRQIGEFIIATTNMARLVTVEELNISRSKKKLPYLSCSLVINIYTFFSK